jgi:hypothetical protein
MIINIYTFIIHAINEYSYSGPSLTFDASGTRFSAWTGTDGFGLFSGKLNMEVA